MDQIELTQEKIDALLKRVEANALQKGDYEIIKSMANAIMTLGQAVDNKAASIKRLLGMLFGSKTEKKKDILDKNKPEHKDGDLTGIKPDPKPESDIDPKAEPEEKDKKPPKSKSEKKKKGHGKIPASDYTGAHEEFISHETLKHKDPCPLCLTGKLYPVKKPGIAIHLKGQPPIDATVYKLEKLRCNLCGEVFTAEAPQGITGKYYDETAKGMIAVLKYGYGLPWYRLEKLQESLGIPLPASTQWEKTESQADLIYPAFDELNRQAAQGEVFHNDDTTMKILELIQENKTRDKDERTGIFTSGIISLLEGGKKIAIFCTGRNHAGENIASIYEKHNGDKDLPIQMCDSLSRNMSSDFKIILCHCITHARRGFVEVISNFPDECRYVIEALAEVYHVDAQAKEQNMTPDQRLAFHQLHSCSQMNDLRSWLDTQIQDKLVEPNSGLGNAITYIIKHWYELTQFLRVPGAPLDNNICEQGLKRCILHRKNSMFYKTEHGAYIGDMYMSIIHTCNLMKVNAFNYLIALQKHSALLFKNPSSWMPWNYEVTMGQLS